MPQTPFADDQPGFHKKRIDAYGAIMVQHTLEMLQTWQEGRREDICGHDRSDSTDCGETLFDADVTGGDTDIVGTSMRTLQECMVEHINMPLPVPKWWPGATNKRKLSHC